MPDRKFRPLQFPESGGSLKDAHCEKQHQKSVADALHDAVDTNDHIPDVAALEIFRRLRNERPQFGKLIVPDAKRMLKALYYPVVTDVLHLLSARKMRPKLERIFKPLRSG